jgi:D-alanyl-D-alanine dipeptidase
VSEFPTSVSLDDLAAPFATQATAFITALRAAGATVSISATLRPANRAFLMHWAWQIVNNAADPQTVPEREGIDIDSAHQDDAGAYSHDKSVAGAQAMLTAYGIKKDLKVSPSLTSRHIEGNAIDTTIR